MQLVPKAQHTIRRSYWFILHPGGYGGLAIWGKIIINRKRINYMKLKEVIEKIEDFDEDSLIFMENLNDINSDILIAHAEENDGGKKEIYGKKYFYLLEIFLIKEFIQDYLLSINHKPSIYEITERVYNYSINDA